MKEDWVGCGSGFARASVGPVKAPDRFGYSPSVPPAQKGGPESGRYPLRPHVRTMAPLALL